MTTVAQSERERTLWARYNALLTSVPGMIDERMRAATGLSRFQFTLLETLADNPEGQVRLAEVARATDSSLSRLSHAISRLEDAGLVKRQACDADRRASWAVLTPAGTRAIADARSACTAVMHDVLLDRIPADRHDDAIALITALLPEDIARTCEAVDS